jgi:hypothetical protein
VLSIRRPRLESKGSAGAGGVFTSGGPVISTFRFPTFGDIETPSASHLLGRCRHRDLEHAVLEVRLGLVADRARRQRHYAANVAVAPLGTVDAGAIFLVFLAALARDRDRVVGTTRSPGSKAITTSSSEGFRNATATPVSRPSGSSTISWHGTPSRSPARDVVKPHARVGDSDAPCSSTGRKAIIAMSIYFQQLPAPRAGAPGAVAGAPRAGRPITGSSSGLPPRPRPPRPGGVHPSHAGPFWTIRVSALTV